MHLSEACANFALVMNFRTIVELPERNFELLDIRSQVLMLGSCFATHVGERLTDALPEGRTEVCPTGVLYNPLSVNEALRVILKGDFNEERYIFQGRDGLWHSWLHTSAFSASTKEACTESISERLKTASALAQRAHIICMTWGTSHVFELATGGFVVGNCHRETSSRFSERRLSIDEIVADTSRTLQLLHEANAEAQVVLTISPFRYAKLGMHGSNLSKSVLHLAAEELEKQFNFVHYFPAYEIVIDELRDYRFYEADMLHPSPVAVEYVWERFKSWTFSEHLLRFSEERANLLRLERHRPLTTDEKMLELLDRQRAEQRAAFHKRWPEAFSENTQKAKPKN